MVWAGRRSCALRVFGWGLLHLMLCVPGWALHGEHGALDGHDLAVLQSPATRLMGGSAGAAPLQWGALPDPPHSFPGAHTLTSRNTQTRTAAPCAQRGGPGVCERAVEAQRRDGVSAGRDVCLGRHRRWDVSRPASGHALPFHPQAQHQPQRPRLARHRHVHGVALPPAGHGALHPQHRLHAAHARRERAGRRDSSLLPRHRGARHAARGSQHRRHGVPHRRGSRRWNVKRGEQGAIARSSGYDSRLPTNHAPSAGTRAPMPGHAGSGARSRGRPPRDRGSALLLLRGRAWCS